MGQHTSASAILALPRPCSCVFGWAWWSSRTEATQIAHARTLPGWHSLAGRQAERKVLLFVPPWAVQPVSIVPSTHYASHSPRLSQQPVPLFLFDFLFLLTFLFSQRRHSLKAPPVSAPPAPRASNKIPICQLGGGRAPDAHLPLPRQGFLSLFFSFSLSMCWHLPTL